MDGMSDADTGYAEVKRPTPNLKLPLRCPEVIVGEADGDFVFWSFGLPLIVTGGALAVSWVMVEILVRWF